jgi:hypothetical protein
MYLIQDMHKNPSKDIGLGDDAKTGTETVDDGHNKATRYAIFIDKSLY